MTHLSYSFVADAGESEYIEHTMSEDDPGHGKNPETVQASDSIR